MQGNSSERSAEVAHLALGAGGRGFKPRRSDHDFHGAIVQRENSAFARRQRGFDSHWLHHFRDATKLVYGGMAERLIAAVLKTAEGSRLPGVQIPLPPPCVAPQGPRTSWAHLEQQARWRAPHCVWPGACPVTLRAASIGEAAFLFPSAPAPRGEQAKAADSLPKRNGAAL